MAADDEQETYRLWRARKTVLQVQYVMKCCFFILPHSTLTSLRFRSKMKIFLCGSFQMCHDRGYLIAQHELDQTLEEFAENFGDKPATEKRPSRNDLLILAQHANDPTGIVSCL